MNDRVRFLSIVGLLVFGLAVSSMAFPRMGGGLRSSSGTLTATYLTASAAGNIASANSYNGFNAIPTGGYFYPTGGQTPNTTLGTMQTTYTGGVPTVTYAITGDTNNCYKMSGANLQVNSNTGACAAGSASETITITAGASGFGGSPNVVVTSYLTQQYYINTAGAGGSDSNNGLSSGAPWLTITHNINCGDVISMAASTSYAAGNFGNTGVSGTITCPGGDNLAYLKCASTLGACKISGGVNGIWATSNYWGFIGVDVEGQTNSCVKSSPPYPPGTGPTVHHFALVNSIVAGCAGSGLQTGQAAGTGFGSDYEIVLGVMAYGNSTATGPCFSGVSFGGDSDQDAAAGPHRLVKYLIGWHNINGASCNGGGTTTDGECFIEDTPDAGPVVGLTTVEAVLCLGNGGQGVEIFAQSNPAVVHPFIWRNITSTANTSDPQHTGSSNTEILVQGFSNGSYLKAQLSKNIAATYAVTSGLNPGNNYGMLIAWVAAATSFVDGNWMYGHGSATNNIISFNTNYTCPNGGGPITPGTSACPGNTITTDPVFAGAAYCTGSQTTTTLTLTSCTGHAVANGMQPFSTAGTQVTSGALLSGCTGSGTITCTSSASQTITSTSMVLLPIPGAPSCSGQSDVIACATAMGIISNFTPTASNATNFGYGASLACDANNTSAYINNVSRMAPAALNPCG